LGNLVRRVAVTAARPDEDQGDATTNTFDVAT